MGNRIETNELHHILSVKSDYYVIKFEINLKLYIEIMKRSILIYASEGL